MDMTSLYEGKNDDGEYVVTVRPAGGAPAGSEIVDYYAHFVPQLLEGQPIHDPSEDCYCLPRLSILERPHIVGTVWKVHHRQVVPKGAVDE